MLREMFTTHLTFLTVKENRLENTEKYIYLILISKAVRPFKESDTLTAGDSDIGI